MYDLAIIGAGAGGIACAKLAASHGIKTILFEKDRDSFGGTCLNRGCIPTKFFLNASKLNKPWQSISIEKKEIIERIKGPALKYLESKGITVKWGNVLFLDRNTLGIGTDTIKAKNIIIACGSSPKKIWEHKKCIFAEDLFNLPDLGKKILIAGAGYIGIEFASLLRSFDKEILIVEKEDKILPFFDTYLSARLRILLEKKGIKIHTSGSLSEYNLNEFDKVILAAGRNPDVGNLGLAKIGVSVHKEGWVNTDKFLRTNIGNIYACGDVTGKKSLAYIAEYQAQICINNIINRQTEENYTGIPECVFSIPQLAKVGILEDEAKQKNLKYQSIKSNFLKFSSAYVYNDTDGFMQVLLDKKDKIIGAGIISNLAAELISIFSLCIKNNLRLTDLTKCIFTHPTFSEIAPLLLKEEEKR